MSEFVENTEALIGSITALIGVISGIVYKIRRAYMNRIENTPIGKTHVGNAEIWEIVKGLSYQLDGDTVTFAYTMNNGGVPFPGHRTNMVIIASSDIDLAKEYNYEPFPVDPSYAKLFAGMIDKRKRLLPKTS